MRLFKITLLTFTLIVGFWSMNTLAQGNDTDFETILCFSVNEEKKCYQLEVELINYTENSHTISRFPVNGFPTKKMVEMVMNTEDDHFYNPDNQMTITNHVAEKVNTRSFCQSGSDFFNCFYLTEVQ